MSRSGKDEQHHAAVAKAWRNWILLFLPLFGASLAGMRWLGFGLVLAILIGLLAAVLFYQRYMNRRSWRSIMWGVHATGE